MDSEELDQRLEGGHETQSFEVKGPMEWDAASLAKDILAMANVRDGGVIVIGVEDKTFNRIGVSDELKATYDIDIMRDQMFRYADPSVDFTVHFPADKMGNNYVAIKVAPFRELPVLCRRDSDQTKAGTMYFRSTNRRVESVPVSNSEDMREIITIAATRTRQRLEDLGWSAHKKTEWKHELDVELEGL